jgi:Holliday junction resolvase RusA-like endonuclease
MTKSDRWKKRPATTKYWEFKDELHKHVKGNLDPTFDVIFHVPMAKSWSKKKKAAYFRMPHQQRPDVDNYVKALMDALCEEDSYVYDVRMQKYWAYEGSIELTERGK